jgi:hypothetical protein
MPPYCIQRNFSFRHRCPQDCLKTWPQEWNTDQGNRAYTADLELIQKIRSSSNLLPEIVAIITQFGPKNLSSLVFLQNVYPPLSLRAFLRFVLPFQLWNALVHRVQLTDFDSPSTKMSKSCRKEKKMTLRKEIMFLLSNAEISIAYYGAVYNGRDWRFFVRLCNGTYLMGIHGENIHLFWSKRMDVFDSNMTTWRRRAYFHAKEAGQA